MILNIHKNVVHGIVKVKNFPGTGRIQAPPRGVDIRNRRKNGENGTFFGNFSTNVDFL